MLKLGKIGAAIFLSLLMSLTLLASGVFAQSATNSNTKTSGRVATATGSQQGVTANLQVVRTRQDTPQQVNRWCRWRRVFNWRWHTWTWVRVCSGWWGGGWHGGGWHGGGWHGGGWHGGGWHGGGWHGGGWHGGGWHGGRW